MISPAVSARARALRMAVEAQDANEKARRHFSTELAVIDGRQRSRDAEVTIAVARLMEALADEAQATADPGHSEGQ